MNTASDISVIIPLYNKASSIERTVRSVLGQRVQPREIIVVDDGSTDGSADIVRRIASPLVRLITQENRGVSAARNRAMAEATGRWVALLDGDDVWEEEYLQQVERMIASYPDCGAYGLGFWVESDGRRTRGNVPQEEGVVDFFLHSMTRYVLIPSATTLDRELALSLGGFPEGMRMGEDQYLWTKIARASRVAFSPKAVAVYSRTAENRSVAIYRAEQTAYSLEDLYDAEASAISNEYVARVALGKALVESVRGGTAEARRAVEFFSYNTMSHRLERKVRVLNALPRAWRPTIYRIYNWLAWTIARRGL